MNKKNILISFDLDGTLLKDNKELDNRNFEYLKKLKSKGYKVIINTGRSYRSAANFFKGRLGVDIIFNNGNACRNVDNDELLFIEPIKNDIAVKFISKVKSKKIQPLVHINLYDRGYDIATIKRYTSEKADKYIKAFGDHVLYLEDFRNLNADIISIVLIGEYEDLYPYKLEFEMDYPDFNIHLMKIHSKHNYMLEILPKTSDKWYGIQRYIKAKGINGIYTISIGDDSNDFLMLKNSDFGIAMINGEKIARDGADIISKYNNNDLGAIKAIDEILEVGE